MCVMMGGNKNKAEKEYRETQEEEREWLLVQEGQIKSLLYGDIWTEAEDGRTEHADRQRLTAEDGTSQRPAAAALSSISLEQ